MMTSEEPGAARPLLLPYSADFGKHCLNCGRPLPERTRKLQCSEVCRRAYQNRGRKAVRRAFLATLRGKVLFCPVCGKPYRGRVDEEEGQACSPCCRIIRGWRTRFHLSPAEHKPNYDLGLHLAHLGRDPWQAHDMTEDEEQTIWGNALLSPIPPEVLLTRKEEARP